VIDITLHMETGVVKELVMSILLAAHFQIAHDSYYILRLGQVCHVVSVVDWVSLNARLQ